MPAGIPDLNGVDVGYADRRDRSTDFAAGDISVPVASFDDIINSKQHADRACGEASKPVVTPVASVIQPPPSAVVQEPVAGHTEWEAAVGALRRELVDLD